MPPGSIRPLVLGGQWPDAQISRGGMGMMPVVVLDLFCGDKP